MARKRGVNLMLQSEEVLARAEALVGTGKYSMLEGRNGGSDPTASSPYGPTGEADCVGVGSYIQGHDRYQQLDFLPDPSLWKKSVHGKLNPMQPIYGGWINTNSVLIPNLLYREVSVEEVLPGDVLVYPSYQTRGDVIPGHWQTVVKVYGLKDPEAILVQHGRLLPTRVSIFEGMETIHCNARTSPATARTKARVAKAAKDTWRFVRPRWR